MKVYKFEKYELERLGQKEIYKMKDAFDFIVQKLGVQKKTKLSKHEKAIRITYVSHACLYKLPIRYRR